MIDNDKLSNSQVWIIMVLTAVGVGIFSLPRSAAEAAGPDGWFVIILGGLIGLLNFYIISRIVRRFPGDTLVEIAHKVLGKFIGTLALLFFWVYMLSIIAMTLRIFGEVVKMSILLRTPIEVILLSLLILVFMLARGGVEPIARFDEVIFPTIAVTLFLVLLFAIPGSDFTNVLPFMRSSPEQLFKGSFSSTYAYGGYEAVLLIIPFINKPEKVFRAGLTAFIIIMITYEATVIMAFAKFGVSDVQKLIWPTLTLIRSIEITGSFIERLEGIVMTQWVLLAFTTIVPFVYGMALIPSRLLNHREFKQFCPLVIPILYILALVPDNVVESYKYLDDITKYLGTPAVLLLPLLLLIVSSVRKVGTKTNG